MTGPPREESSEAVRLVVALETSTRPASIAARGPSGQRAARSLGEDRRHASDLFGALEELVTEVGATRSDLGLVLAGVGPGSYTGLRVGAATALGLMRGAQAEVLGIPSFDAIAVDGLAPGERGAVLRNAFGGHLYIATYERADKEVQPLTAPRCVQPSEAIQLLTGTPVLLADEAALKALGQPPPAEMETRQAALARAEHVLDLGLSRLDAGAKRGPETLRPLYLRPFDAKVRRR
jgi:tRNA threonylcarbamoyladenosine biosynthesis protein TsaB